MKGQHVVSPTTSFFAAFFDISTLLKFTEEEVLNSSSSIKHFLYPGLDMLPSRCVPMRGSANNTVDEYIQ